VAFIPLLFLIPLWFLLVRPQQRRVRAQQALVRTLETGDDVVTSAGIYGSIVGLDDEVVTLEVAEGVSLRIARAAIARRLNAHADEMQAGGLEPPRSDLRSDPDEPGQTLPPPPPPVDDQ
jgi:preprotein translocase subunit YajC